MILVFSRRLLSFIGIKRSIVPRGQGMRMMFEAVSGGQAGAGVPPYACLITFGLRVNEWRWTHKDMRWKPFSQWCWWHSHDGTHVFVSTIPDPMPTPETAGRIGSCAQHLRSERAWKPPAASSLAGNKYINKQLQHTSLAQITLVTSAGR